jgi:hypothetical protein
MKILGLVDLDQQWMEEILGEGQIRRSRKHRRRGLTRSQKLLSSPIDFFSNINELVEGYDLETLNPFSNNQEVVILKYPQ